VSTSQALTITTIAVFTALALAWQILSAWSGEQTTAEDDGPTRGLALDDTARGIDAGWQDECELIYSMPDFDQDADLAAGFDRLRTAIHEHREEDGTR
jgi:hypothetical protein